MRKKTDGLILVVFLISLGLLPFAVWKLLDTYAEYRQGDETYEELQDYVQTPDENNDKETPDEPATDTEDSGNGYLQVDFEGLKKINPDVIAWIQIPALDISYPVVQGKDNYYYLHHMFDGQEIGRAHV